jgi:hypothetical protein
MPMLIDDVLFRIAIIAGILPPARGEDALGDSGAVEALALEHSPLSGEDEDDRLYCLPRWAPTPPQDRVGDGGSCGDVAFDR